MSKGAAMTSPLPLTATIMELRARHAGRKGPKRHDRCDLGAGVRGPVGRIGGTVESTRERTRVRQAFHDRGGSG